MLTIEILGVVCLAHVVVDFTAFGGGDVCCGIVTFTDEFLEQWVDITEYALAIESALHLLLFPW